MEDDIKRSKRIAKLDLDRVKGERARVLMDQLEPVFEQRRQAYFIEAVTETRKTGEAYAAAVWKMVALDDLVTDLDRDISRGSQAARKLQEMQETDR